MTCDDCGVIYTGNLNISQLEELIRNGSLENLNVVSAMTDAANAYLNGEKGALQDSEKGRRYYRIAAKNGSGEALFMLGLTDISGLEEIGDAYTQKEVSLINSGLRKLACGHHMGNSNCTFFLTSYIDDELWKGVWSNKINEMMRENTSELWDW